MMSSILCTLVGCLKQGITIIITSAIEIGGWLLALVVVDRERFCLWQCLVAFVMS